MDQLKEVAKKAGMDDSQCEAATGGILSLLKKNLSEDQFKMIEDKIPGATASAEAQDRGASASLGGGMGGMLGGAMSALGGGGGGGATDIAGLTAMLASKGVDTSMISKYLPQVTDFLKSKGIDVSSVLGGGGGDAAAAGGGGGGLGGLAGMASGFKF